MSRTADGSLLPAASFAHSVQAPWHHVSRWCGHSLCWWHPRVPSCPPSQSSPARAAPRHYRSTASEKRISKEEIIIFSEIFLTILRPSSLIQMHLSIKSTAVKIIFKVLSSLDKKTQKTAQIKRGVSIKTTISQTTKAKLIK